jgi:hypothetical protein
MTSRVRQGARAAVQLLRHPSHLAVVVRDALSLARARATDARHLEETINWLCRAQDATGSGGVSAAYAIAEGGWLPPYPETTGYIIPTFLNHARATGRVDLFDRAVRMGDWEIEIQLESGAVRGGIGLNDYPIAFNTGQVIHGWVALYRETREPRFLKAAKASADWLATVQDADGKWTAFTPTDTPQPYYTFVTWALLDYVSVTADARSRAAAERNLEWTLRQATADGWFPASDFPGVRGTLTHFFGYTVQGLLECARLTESDSLRGDLIRVARASSQNMRRVYERGRQTPGTAPDPLPAAVDANWRSSEAFSCVTGDAQFAIVWLMMYTHFREARDLEAAQHIIEFVKSAQSLTSWSPGVRGAVPGSFPCWGKYFPLGFPNWAAKFFADALMLSEAVAASVPAPPDTPRVAVELN